MAENTKIEWATHTFNPWIGCQKVGPGCDFCYAEILATQRLGVTWGPGAPRKHTAVSTWNQPRKWNRKAEASGDRPRVFCSSLADVFDNAVDPAWRHDLGQLIRETPFLDWLLLTKRIGNAVDMLYAMFDGDLPPNFRVGATIVNQDEWNRDVPKIAQVAVLIGKARIFLSMEPLLGAVDLAAHPRYDWTKIVGWVIVGGESGRQARPMHPDWLISLRDQCLAAGVTFMFKQWGEWLPVHRSDVHRTGYEFQKVGKKASGRRLHGETLDGVPA